MGGRSLVAGGSAVALAVGSAVLGLSPCFAEDNPEATATIAIELPSVPEGTPAETPANKPAEDPATTAALPSGTEDAPPAAAATAQPTPDGPATVEQNSVEPPPPADPIVAAIREKLADPALRKGASEDELAALESFYAGLAGPPLWITSMGFSTRAQNLINEIEDADDWGLSADAFDLPPASDLPSTTDAQAVDEVKLGLAVLKYARYARGGRLTPSRVSSLFDQKRDLLDPKDVLRDIAASPSPAAYLRSLHPKQPGFERLRQALLKARAKIGTAGKKAANEREIQRLVVNLERWRWMPRELGSFHVWNNVPEFNARVVKNDKTIYVEKTIVGQLKYATPIFSANMRSIVFHPEWTVPDTILKEDLQPALQRPSGLFSGPNTAILDQHKLRVSYQGKPIDPSTVDWTKANIRQFSFTQAPGPSNVLGTLKFNFPNKHAVYMHDTSQPELFAARDRTLSHGCIRVQQPDRLAALLLAEDKGWSAAQVKSMLARDRTSVVTLSRAVPVHLTYFTAVADDEGKVQFFADIYGLDSRMAKALFGKPVQFQAAPASAREVTAQGGPRRKPTQSTSAAGGGLSDAISGLFGN